MAISGDQIKQASTHVFTAAASIVGTLAAVKVISGGDATSLQHSLDQIGHGVAEIVAGITALIVAASGAYATFMASPLVALFRSAAAVASDPAKLAQLHATPIEQQVSIVTVADKLPDVAGVGTTRTDAGKALALAVPSNTVQPVQSQPNVKVAG